MEGKAEDDEENVAWENVVEKVQSDQVLHQSGSSKEDKKDKKEHKGKVENKVTDGFVTAEAIITHCRIHAKVNTWVVHHP